MNPYDMDAEFKSGLVSRKALDALNEAEAMNCATSISWLEGKLRILENSIGRRPLHIDSPGASRTLITAADFTAWCRARFPNAYGLPSPVRPAGQISDWVHENLINGGKFVFDDSGVSRFGENMELYSTPLQWPSLLVSAMEGVVQPAPFRVGELLAILKDVCAAETASWVWCSENPVGGAARVLSVDHFDEKIWPFDDAYPQIRMLSRFEQIDPLSLQSGDRYLQLLLPDSYRWVLVGRRNSDSFQMELHGERVMLDIVRQRLHRAEAP